MGTNCAVYLANLFLFSYELEYITKLLVEKDYTRIEALRLTKRYLDDIITINNPHFELYKYDLYPKNMLTLNKEQDNLPLHCLDVHIYYNNKTENLETKSHSKKDDPKFKALTFTKYPHPHSYIHQNILYNTFTTELHRLNRINSNFSTFHKDTNRLIDYLIHKGYNKKRLLNKLQSFVKENLPLYNYTTPLLPYNNIAGRDKD